MSMLLRSAGLGDFFGGGGLTPGSIDTSTPTQNSFYGLLSQLSQEHHRELQECHDEIAHLKHALEVRDKEIDVCRRENRRLGEKRHSVGFDVKKSIGAACKLPSMRRSGSWPAFRSSSISFTSLDVSGDTLNGGEDGAVGVKRVSTLSVTTVELDDDQPKWASDKRFRSMRSVSSNFVAPAQADEDILDDDGQKLAGTLMIFAQDPSIRMRIAFEGWFRFSRSMRTPVCFKVWPSLAETSFAIDAFDPSVLRQSNSNVSSVCSHDRTAVQYNRYCGHLLVQPGGNFRISWDLLGTFFLAYDIVMIPLSAFGPERDGFITVMEWITLLFWTGDMFMSCVTGVVVKGITMMEPRTILMVYLRTWFLLDVVVVVPDWIFTIMAMANGPDSKGGAASGGKLLRALRVLRTIRLLRLAKLQRILILLRDRIESEVTFIIVNICRLVLMLLTLNHFLAASWWSVGNFYKDSGSPNWIDTMNFKDDGEVAYKYMTALHWSICMFTPGSMSVQPQNVGERLMAILILVCGLVVFTTFISSVTASVAALRTLQGDKGKTLWMLRRYLRQQNIEKGLQYRVLRYVDNALLTRSGKKLSADKVVALKMLTDGLHAEVNYEANFSFLRVHPLFERMLFLAKVTVFRLVGTALSQRPLAKNDVLFAYGGQATHMHLVVSGAIEYIRRMDELVGVDAHAVKDDWLCEPILWVRWMHLGVAKAMMPTDMVCVRSDSFIDGVKMDSQTSSLVRRYAQRYAEHLCNIARGKLTDMSKRGVGQSLALYLLEEGTDSAMEYSTLARSSKVFPLSSGVAMNKCVEP